jgi:hypothetical protein
METKVLFSYFSCDLCKFPEDDSERNELIKSRILFLFFSSNIFSIIQD